MNAIEILENDHQEIIIVMEELEGMLSTEDADYDATFQKFKQLFKEHDEAEDEVVYPRLKEHEELRKLILKGYQAHNVVHSGILQLRLWPYATETWGAKFAVVKDCILTHIEEEKKVFSLASTLCTAQELQEMGEEIQKLRN
jgi:hemerythrin-like domain-containing protein